MWSTLALSLALQLAPAQNGALAVEGEHFRYGYFGAERKDNAFLPGDVVFLAFNVKNLTFDSSGKASFSIAMEILDGDGMSRFRQEPRNQQTLDYLGGKMLQSVADMPIPLTAKPGDYTIKLTVTDRATKSAATLTSKTKVLPADFGVIHVHTTPDREGKAAIAPVATLGESLYVNFAVVGFQRDAKKVPSVEVKLRVLDDKGNQVSTPLTGKIDREIPDDLKIIPLQFGLTLNRVGRFTMELSATDTTANKTSQVTLPLKVTSLD
jgi:hypothetical protein